MRPLSACVACRDRRKRCTRTRPGVSCDFCIRRGLECFFEPRPNPAATVDGYEPLTTPSPGGSAPWASSAVMPDPDLTAELVDLYFRYIHVAFHNIFHRPSFEASVRDGTVPRVLLFGVMSLAARFSNHASFANTDPLIRGRAYANETERLLDLHKTCLTTIQACMLIAAIQVVEMQSTTESIFYTIACRMALIMDLPNATAYSLLEQEINLRVWWSVVATDTWSSAALGLPRAIEARYDSLMPMDERVFLKLCIDSPPDAGLSVRSPLRSLIVQMILLNQILYKVNSLNTKSVSEDMDTSQLYESINRLLAELNDWHSGLPQDMVCTPENLIYWAREKCGAIFVILHNNYNHLGQLLLYRFLNLSLKTNDAMSLDYARRCKKYADDFCELIYRAKEHPHTNVRYPLLGHMLVVASTVQLHTLLFSSEDAEVQSAKGRLETNYGIISLLQTYWPSLKASSSRFDTFHKACLEGKDSFRFDRWMLQFLLEFAEPISERD